MWFSPNNYFVKIYFNGDDWNALFSLCKVSKATELCPELFNSRICRGRSPVQKLLKFMKELSAKDFFFILSRIQFICVGKQ